MPTSVTLKTERISRLPENRENSSTFRYLPCGITRRRDVADDCRSLFASAVQGHCRGDVIRRVINSPSSQVRIRSTTATRKINSVIL